MRAPRAACPRSSPRHCGSTTRCSTEYARHATSATRHRAARWSVFISRDRSSAGLSTRHGDLIRMLTLAPEADPDLAATRFLAAQGVIVAIGHTACSFAEAVAA